MSGGPSKPSYWIDVRQAEPAEFYALACDPARPVAVEACAGAGKTWMLVARVLRALLDGAEPHQILAITFTRKAAGEMRARVLELVDELARASHEERVQALIERGIAPGPAENAAKQLQSLKHRLLAAERPIQIRTFHSWFATLLRAAPMAVLQEFGLPSVYELIERDEEVFAEVWRPFHAAVSADPSLQADYAALVAAVGRSGAIEALSALLQRRTEFALADALGVVERSVAPAQALFPALAGYAEPALALCTEAARARWLQRAQALGRARAKTAENAARAIVDAFEAHALGAADPRDGAVQGGDTEQAHALLEALRAALFVRDEDRLKHHLGKFPEALEAEAELRELLAARRQHGAWMHQQRMLRLGRCLLGVYAELKRARGWVDMGDIERAAHRLLADPTLSGWVQERLDAQLRHLLIDEFQDTNPLQWQALYAWLSAYAGAGTAPSVFIVGDPKQSIYRFRRAEPQVFVAAQRFIREGLGGSVLGCDHSRRCASAVIEAVNTVMEAAQAAGETTGFRTHSTESNSLGEVGRLPAIPRASRSKARSASDAAASEPAADAGGAGNRGDAAAADRPNTEDAAAVVDVPVWRDSLNEPRLTAEETLLEREARQVAAWIAARIALGAKPEQFMVLARQRARLSLLDDALRALGIATQQPERSDLSELPEVQDVVALLDVLVSPVQDLSLARALKSPLFGVSDDALVRLSLRVAEARRREAAAVTWLSVLLSDGAALDPALERAARLLPRWQAALAALPPHDALAQIFDEGEVVARFVAAAPLARRSAVQAWLHALLQATLHIAGGRCLTPYAVVRALKRAGQPAPPLGDAAAVRLLTIHGAKGLEADCVVLLDSDKLPQGKDRFGVLVDWPAEAPAPKRLVFLSPEADRASDIASLYEREQAERRREELNALYVAMTRARETLVLSAVEASSGTEPTPWRRLMPHVPEWVVPPASTGLPNTGLSGAATSSTVLLRGLEPLPVEGLGLDPKDLVRSNRSGTEAITRIEAPDDETARVGQAMHWLLEHEARVFGAPAGAAPDALLRSVQQRFGLDGAQADRAWSLARAARFGAAQWAWDAAVIDWQANEVPLLWQGQLLRIDRLVRRRDGAWWVLDFKSAAQPQAQDSLRLQLERYRAAVAAFHPGAEVYAGFVTGAGQFLVLPEPSPDRER